MKTPTPAPAATAPRAASPAPAASRSVRRSGGAGRLVPYGFLLPAYGLFALAVLYPILITAQISLYKWSPLPGAVQTFVGLDNYTRALGDEHFWLSMVNVAVYLLVTVPGQVVIGLFVALLLNRKLPGRAVFRVLFYLPVVTSWVVVSLLFRYLFTTDGGLVNWALGTDIAWLDNRWTALASLCALGIWKGIGWTAVILLAGLQGISEDLHEAASLDGAGRLRRLWHITLPGLRRNLLFVTVLLVIGSFQVFISVLLMTSRGPAGQTEVPLTYVYQQAFEFLDFGYGSALALIMTVLVLVLSIVQTLFVNQVEK
ncbi:sugar ABC transporter permease [Streptomyces sp. NPDC047108]|uniref:carbohydrate ABC transporter permease n=1 Tax=Streptomyces sp. NPDC047108 TaxID=3155025 RepID=UPI0033CE1561